jgi:hypothetical protein
MRISKDENPDFYEKLFGDIGKYEQWAPYFYPEFVAKYTRMKGVVVGVMTPSQVHVNDLLDDEFEIWLECKGIFLHDVYHTRTAEFINKFVLLGYEEYQRYSDVPAKKRVKPTEEQAREYVKCVKTLQYFYEGVRFEGIEKISWDEYPAFSKKEEEFAEMALDMRDVIFEENGKVGLRRVTGEVLVPALFDEIPERYDYISEIRDPCGRVPVVRDHKYALCKTDGKGTLVTDFAYDRIFRYFWSNFKYFITVNGGKKGVIAWNGKEIVPCEMDEIYEMMDADGCIPLRRGDKWGLVYCGVATEVIYDDYKFDLEMGMVKKEGKWYYINSKGQPVTKIEEGSFFSTFDASK